MGLKVHHLNCATMCPFGGRLVSGEGGLLEPALLICHCLLIETPSSGLLLVDTGIGTLDIADPGHTLGKAFVRATRPSLSLDETAVRQVERLGFKADDVRHIAVTHLDLDHAGGLPDFPRARVHIYEPEHRAAMARAAMLEKERYRPHQWAHNPAWAPYPSASGERWFGFECVRDLEGLPPEILLVPLVGHSRGHSGVAVQGEGGWLLHAGDAYFFRGEVHPDEPPCPPALSFFQSVVEIDRAQRLRNQARLRQLRRDHGAEVTIFSAHDPVELRRLC